MKDTKSPMGTSPEQSELLRSIGLPDSTADMYLVKHWASPFGEFKIMDKHYDDYPPEGVDHIPAWSLARLIDLLPEFLSIIEGDDIDNSIQYDLHINKNYVRYMAYENSEPAYETFGFHPIDAVVEMIEKLAKDGWKEEMLCQFNKKQ